MEHREKARLQKTKLTDEEVFRKNSGLGWPSTRQYYLKWMIRAGKYSCSSCSISHEWNGKFIVLQPDHVNGNHEDNRFENLRLLCPNCHSQTPTFGGANAKKTKERGKRSFEKYFQIWSPK